MTTLQYKISPSPVGSLKIVANDHSLLAILWDNEKPHRVRLDAMTENKQHPILRATETQLNEYFLQRRTSFNLPLELSGTPFQKSVWNLLSQIPYGVTLTYSEIAHRMHNPKAVRAVGAAIGRNPISIIVPCHRVIASNGSLTGFAGGLDRKKILLNLELDFKR